MAGVLWSEFAAITTPANQAPTFTATTATRTLDGELARRPEPPPAIPSEPDGDSDSLTYSVTEPNSDKFTVDPSDGQIRAGDHDYNHEATTSYTLTLKVVDGHEGTDTITVRVNINDVLEPPGKPDLPTASQQSLTSLTFAWQEPANTGPAITDYDAQWRKGTSGDWTDVDDITLTRSATLENLDQNETYQLQARATNAEGTGEWSDPGASTTKDNSPPSFNEGTATTRSVAENTATVTDLGAALAVTDSDINDGGSLSYSITTLDVPFTVDGSTGQIKTVANAGYDHETEPSHRFNIQAQDGQGGSDSITVTVSITDVNEPPGKPDKPTSSDSTITSVTIDWNAPTNTGPAITGYDVRYREEDTTTWTDHTPQITDLTVTIDELARGAEHHFQVQATNPEGTGAWSDTGEHSTKPNNKPVFTSTATTVRISIPEDTAGGSNIGDPVETTERDEDDIAYSLSGAQADLFTIGASDGQLGTDDDTTFNYEVSPNTYSFTITADDGEGGKTTIDVTVTITDVNEPPEAPQAPTISDPTSTSLKLSWTAPGNDGPPINGYNVRFGKTENGPWTQPEHDDTTTTTLTGLTPNTRYWAQVQAANAEGTGNWSPASNKPTSANNLPQFQGSSNTSSRTLAENTPGGRNIGAPVSATDVESKTLAYTLGGADASSFQITSATGQLRTASGIDYDFESEKTTYQVTVKATDQHNGTTTKPITITLTDVDEKPDPPATPDIVSATLDSLTVSWQEPRNTGPDITDYDLQYREGTSGSWTDAGFDGTNRTTTLDNLGQSRDHQVQVRAKSPEGTSGWSESATGRTSDNASPTFNLQDNQALFAIPENVEPGHEVGTLTATDSDGGVITYSIGAETDASRFQADSSTGEITTAPGSDFNHETQQTHTFTVRAEDGQGGSATAQVTVTVNDLPEPPQAPTLTVTGTTFNSATLEWNEPENTGPPITGYNLQYQQGDSGGFNNAEDPGLNRSQTIPQLKESTLHQARVQAVNDEGPSEWSEIAEFTTSANRIPVFTPPGAASIPEGTAPGVTVLTVSAQDPEGQGVTYHLDASPPFDIGASSGEITTVDHPYDHETAPEYEVTVVAQDTLGARAHLPLTIRVENIDEDPTGLPVIKGTPQAGQTLSADLSGIQDPDGTPPQEEFSHSWIQDGQPIPGATHSSLPLDSSHLGSSISLRVTFTDGGGFQETLTSPPVGPVAPTPTAPMVSINPPPVWNGDTQLQVDENQTLVANQLTAGDLNASDAITSIRISSGEDAPLLQVEANTGAGTVSLSFLKPPDYEKPVDHDGDNIYHIVLEATSREGNRERRATTSVSIEVRDALEPPLAPILLRARDVTHNSATILWEPGPEAGGPPVTLHTLRYPVEEEGAKWNYANAPGDATSLKLTGLKPHTQHELQVRAENAEGSSPWSEPLGLKTSVELLPTTESTHRPTPEPTPRPTPEDEDEDDDDDDENPIISSIVLPVFKAVPTPVPTATPAPTPEPTTQTAPEPTPTRMPAAEVPTPTPTVIPEAKGRQKKQESPTPNPTIPKLSEVAVEMEKPTPTATPTDTPPPITERTPEPTTPTKEGGWNWLWLWLWLLPLLLLLLAALLFWRRRRRRAKEDEPAQANGGTGE